MFKKTLVAAALTTAAMGANAWQVAQNETSSLEVYGVTAMSIVSTFHEDSNKDNGWALDNETRVGFRGHKDLADNLVGFMQVESGWVDTESWNGIRGGVLGQRDTFVGLRGTWGQVRFGRVLTPMYEIVDWPFSNPGMGGVFDWNSDIGKFHNDRQSNQIRYDGNFGGLGLAVSMGRGSEGGYKTSGGGAAMQDNYFYGASANYRFADMVTVQAGLETESERGGKGAAGATDTLGAILGVQVSLPAGFSVKGAYKYGSVEDIATGVDSNQSFVSLIGEYWTGNLGFRVGYAAAFDAEVDGHTAEKTNDNVISFQPMYVMGGAVFYGRIKAQTMNEGDTDITARLGLEYGF